MRLSASREPVGGVRSWGTLRVMEKGGLSGGEGLGLRLKVGGGCEVFPASPHGTAAHAPGLARLGSGLPGSRPRGGRL